MDLKIHNDNTIYQLTGSLNKYNLYHFKKEFQNVFDKQSALVINIEMLSSIDRYGVNALAQLHNQALLKGKKLSIIGMGEAVHCAHFKPEETAA